VATDRHATVVRHPRDHRTKSDRHGQLRKATFWADICRPSKAAIPVKLREAKRVDSSQCLAQDCRANLSEAAYENTIGGEWFVVVL
jgi:hypothetical protein